MPRTSKKAAASLVLGSLLVTSLGLSLIGEAAVRYRERTRSTNPGVITQALYPHDRLGQALVRNGDYYGWMTTNRYGFRGAEVPLTKPGNAMRILAVGGSTTHDSFVSTDAKAWPARLEEFLNAKNPNRSFRVLNTGVPGYTVLDNLIRLQQEFHRFDPDLIILYHAHNDLSCALRDAATPPQPDPDRPHATRAITPWTQWLRRHSLLYHKLVGRFAAIRAAREGVQNADSPARDEADGMWRRCDARQFERDLSSFLAIAQSLEIDVVLPQVAHVSGVGSPRESDPERRTMWSRIRAFADPDDQVRGYAEYDAVARSVASRFGVPYIAAHPDLRDVEHFWDAMHFSDAGAELFARTLAETLTKRFGSS